MAHELRSLAAVSAAVAAAMSYARFAASRLRPGLPRLAALVPVLTLLPALPLAFSSVHLRGISAFYLAWLAEFKLLLLASGRGPLHPSLPFPAFVAAASLPVKLREQETSPARATRAGLDLVSSAVMAALLAAIVSLYRYTDQMDKYLLLSLYGLHVYLALELVLASAAAAARAVLGMELEPQFDKPYIAASLRDFWGRRWNLMVPAVLRPCVYRPVRALLGSAAAGVAAAFLVSGLMHEVMFSYITLQPPTGEATAFFALHGACAAAEGWCAARKGWPRPPRAAATALTLVFVAVTGFWLFFPPITRRGADREVIAECEAMAAFLTEAGERLASLVRSVWTVRQ